MAGYFEFRCADGDRLAAHLLQKCDDGQDFIFREPDRILIDRRHRRRIFLRHPSMSIIVVHERLGIRQTLIEEVPAQFGADPLQIRATGGFAGTDGMAQAHIGLY